MTDGRGGASSSLTNKHSPREVYNDIQRRKAVDNRQENTEIVHSRDGLTHRTRMRIPLMSR
jgi:hypothetical protein